MLPYLHFTLTALKCYWERNATVYRVATGNSSSIGAIPRVLFQVALVTGILLGLVHLARRFQRQNNPNSPRVMLFHNTQFSNLVYLVLICSIASCSKTIATV